MFNDFLEVLKPKKVHNYFEFWNYTDINGSIVDTHLNGNVRYHIDIVNNKFVNNPNMITKSFEYENDMQDYQQYYIDKFKKIKSIFVDPYNFPNPVHIDIIQIFEKDIADGFMLHFKSGVGYQSFYNKQYAQKKLIEIEKIINRKID